MKLLQHIKGSGSREEEAGLVALIGNKVQQLQRLLRGLLLEVQLPGCRWLAYTDKLYYVAFEGRNLPGSIPILAWGRYQVLNCSFQTADSLAQANERHRSLQI